MIQVQTCSFVTTGLYYWKGRYARIPGNGSVFHLKFLNGRWWPALEWETDDGVGTCAALDTPAAREIAVAVNAAKLHAGGSGGGSFLINEFGLVLVPASDGGGTRYFVGRIEGSLVFENPFEFDDTIDLGDCRGLQCGDPWKAPYVGMVYHLSKRSQIYFWQVDEDGGRSVYPPVQDQSLIRALRSLRRQGSVKFLVNPAGVVLTKCPVDNDWSPEETWQPHYVGRINKNAWFEKEVE